MEKLEINRHIPFGITLQDVISHPSLTDSKLRTLLRMRGIYLEDFKDMKHIHYCYQQFFLPMNLNS